MNWNWYARRDLRKIHRWGAILIALPFLIVLLSGLFLQVKKEFNWIQPPTQDGTKAGASLSFDEILSTARGIPELETSTWEDIDRLIFDRMTESLKYAVPTAGKPKLTVTPRMCYPSPNDDLML